MSLNQEENKEIKGSKKRPREELNDVCKGCVEFNYKECYGAKKGEFHYPEECPMYESMEDEEDEDYFTKEDYANQF